MKLFSSCVFRYVLTLAIVGLILTSDLFFSLDAAAQAPTTTTLTVSPTSSTAAPLSAKTVVTLTATVMAGTTPVHPGLVTFCDASAPHCIGLAVQGTVQLTSAGTAVLKFVPGPGSHSYQAVFAGTTTFTTSSSTSQSVTVAPPIPNPTTTNITSSGSAGNYTLTATVSGIGSFVAPTGNVTFLDTTNSNYLLGTAALGPPTLTQSFVKASGSPVAAGSFPSFAAAGDFNGDGIQDLAVTNQVSNNVNILLGNGSGGFTNASGSPIAVGAVAYGVAVGDFNGDGITDLAVTNFGSGTVSILLGNGDGTFTQTLIPTVAVGTNPYGVAVGDFNGDGVADLVITNETSSTVRIFLGNGDGTFTQATGSPVPVGTNPYSVAVADFNGDGIQDLAVANNGSGNVSILLGNGNGTFTNASASPIAVGSTFALATGDFNGDGIPDLAVTNYAVSGTVRLLLGNGDGTFTNASGSPVAVGNSPIGVNVGDFNGDGIADLAVANNGNTTVSILLGNGSGGFAPSSGSPVTVGSPRYMAVGDFNGDGITDLAVPNYSTATISVLLTQIVQTATATLTGVSIPGGGTHNVDASYPGDTNFSGGTSPTIPLVGTPIPTTLGLAATPTTSMYGQQVVLTATLNPYSVGTLGTNGETISFYNGLTLLGTGTLASGVATLNVTTLPVGANSLTAVYSGDTNFLGSASSAVAFTVTRATTMVTLSLNPTTVMYGNTSEMMAVVLQSGATGTVTFSATPTTGGAAIVLGAASVDDTGMAVFPESTLGAGTYDVTAHYNGDLNFAAATSSAVILTVTQRTGPSGGAALTVTVNDASRSTTQMNPPFTYTVAGTLVNGDTYGTAVTGTPAYSSNTGSAAGTFPIKATGLTSSNYVITVLQGTLTIVPAPTTTTLSSSPASPQYGDPVTLTATVVPSGATGTASFYDGAVYLGQGALSGGVATLPTTTLNAGTHTIMAVYNGDSTYASSEASAVVVVAKRAGPGPGGAALTVTVQNASRQFGTANPEFEYVVTGALVNGDTYPTAISGVPIYSSTDTPGSPAGSTYPINVSGLVSQNYVVALVPGTLTIVSSRSITTLAASATSTQYGDPVTLTATVVPNSATGTVIFSNGSTVLGTGTVSGGIATLTTSTLNAGTYIITANYEGDSNFGASTSSPVTVIVAQKTAPGGGPALTVTVASASRSYGQGNPVFTYAVTGTLVDGDTYQTAVTGVPVFATSATATSQVGSYSISLTEGLNSRNYVISFVSGMLTVGKGTPVVTVASSLNPSTYTASVTFTAAVSAGATGTITFMDGSTVLSIVTITGTAATLTTTTLSVGTHPITAVYSGDRTTTGRVRLCCLK